MSDHKTMTLTLIVWRQKKANDPGKFETYTAKNITEHHSFLEMLDCVNEDLINDGKDPIVFDHDCREGICGMCSQVINGAPHGGQDRTTVCQLHMRKFKDGDTIYIEPWRARAFPIVASLSSNAITSAPPASSALALARPEAPSPNSAAFLPAKLVSGIIAASAWRGPRARARPR